MRKAPSGAGRHRAARVDGQSFEDHDEDVVVTREVEYMCGCLSIQHEYHDGTISRKIVHHDGRVLVDELLSAE